MIEWLARIVPHLRSRMSGNSIWLSLRESFLLLKAKRVDHYWNEVFQIKTNSGTSKYTKLSTLIKVMLAFQNSNAPDEKSLSDSKNSVTAQSTLLMEETIIGMREMKEYVWKYGGAHSFPVTEDMIKGKKKARS